MGLPISVVILAAGLGTRMKSRKAKVLHRAGGKTLAEHVTSTALEIAPAERIFVVVGHQAEEVRKALPAPGIGFIDQKEQKGTGHAVLVGREQLEPLGGYLIVIYGDGPLLRSETLRQLAAHTESSQAACVLLSASMDDPTGYGRIIRGADGSVSAIVEQKDATEEQRSVREANMGIYCYRADLFWKYAGEIRPRNAAGEYYLTDMVEILSRHGHTVEAITLPDPREALGINTRAQLAEVDGILRQRKVQELMLGGVTIEKPETVTIDADVCVGMDTVIGPFAQLVGKTRIGENCRVGSCAIIEDSELEDDVEIAPFTIVRRSQVGRAAVVGPFARLREANTVEAEAHIGNFVELKKTRLGARAKANHLAYLGDSVIGAATNIGAGTITCNYDGERKYPTVIGPGAFVGSNSTLVAPLEIGAGAYLAAGSVITESVPADALALGRARQVVKAEWASKRRARRKESKDGVTGVK